MVSLSSETKIPKIKLIEIKLKWNLITQYAWSEKTEMYHNSCIRVFQNEEMFVQLDELDKLDNNMHAWIRIHLQSCTSTENILE